MFSLKKLIRSFGYAFKGIYLTVATGQNMRIHLVATILVIGAGCYFHISVSEWCFIVICIGMVWMAETFNSAIETLTNHVQPNLHPIAGKVKDMAAGAVLASAIAAAVVGVLVFGKYILAMFGWN